jgi:hypothetical protein
MPATKAHFLADFASFKNPQKDCLVIMADNALNILPKPMEFAILSEWAKINDFLTFPSRIRYLRQNFATQI